MNRKSVKWWMKAERLLSHRTQENTFLSAGGIWIHFSGEHSVLCHEKPFFRKTKARVRLRASELSHVTFKGTKWDAQRDFGDSCWPQKTFPSVLCVCFYGTFICLSTPEALKTSGEHRETRALSRHWLSCFFLSGGRLRWFNGIAFSIFYFFW